MKKIVTSILLVTVLLLTASTVKAADGETGQATAQMSLTVPSTLPTDTKTFSASIYLGSITNLDEGKVVGYTATLTYDTALVESVEVQGKNGWSVTYANGGIVANIDNVEENKETATITFTLKQGIEAGKTLKISLGNLTISNDGNLDQTLNLEKTVTFKAVEQPAGNQTGNETTGNVENQVGNQVKNQIENQVSKNTIKDLNSIANTNQLNATNKNALTATKLPKAGQKNFLIIAIFVTIIAGIACIIRAKTIKLK